MKTTGNKNAAGCAVGIELGSTRVKAIMTDGRGKVLASGVSVWENRFENGIWTYSYDDITRAVRECWAALKKDVKERCGFTLARPGYIGVSGMMHGYLPLGDDGTPLVSFRTWRNNCAAEAAEELTRAFGFNIPARWSVAHLWHAVRSGEEHTGHIRRLTTLAGYVHMKLTGEHVAGIGEASGMFPVLGTEYDPYMAEVTDCLLKKRGMPYRITGILPRPLAAGKEAGRLTAAGAAWLDEEGDLEAGVPLCPPEGDAGTGMVATNCVRVGTGNVSAGTSVFATVVSGRRPSVSRSTDVVATPAGDIAVMVHCNNCTSDLNAWADVFAEARGVKDKDELYSFLFSEALEGEPDCGGLIAYNCVSGEDITGIAEGRPMLLRRTEDKLSLPNLMRAHLYSAFAALKLGMDGLRADGITAERIVAHGGIFRTKGAPQKFLAAAAGAPVEVAENAGEGGAWGMALLAEFAMSGGTSLCGMLDDVFADVKTTAVSPDDETVRGMARFMADYERGLPVVREAVAAYSERKTDGGETDDEIAALKKRVYEANLALVKNGLVIFTWGNVSGIDRKRGLVAIKPSGVDYDKMTADDIVVVDMDGNVVYGDYRPSSDTPTHLELYKAHPGIGGVVHTHSTYATAYAQACRSLPAYGTTHADYFRGDVPCTRPLTEEEISGDYEKNTGKVINETIDDAAAVPGVLVGHHGPFAWGKDPDEAVYNATVLEKTAEMAFITENVSVAPQRVPGFLLDRHYLRKHGANAYYGQKKR